jgi:hypothetical protein
MAVQVPTPLFPPTTLGTSNVTLYTLATTPSTLVLRNVRMRFANITAFTHSVTAYAVPAGGSPSSANECVSTEGVAGNSHLDVDMPALGPGGFYAASADVGGAIVAFDIGAILFS